MNKETATVPTIGRKRLGIKPPSPRQRKVAKLIVDAIESGTTYTANKELIKTAGYGTSLQNAPSKVLETTGVKDALAELGFTEISAKKVVQSILESEDAKHSDRLKAADMVFKVHGTYAAEKHMTLNIDANVDTQAMLELAERLRNASH